MPDYPAPDASDLLVLAFALLPILAIALVTFLAFRAKRGVGSSVPDARRSALGLALGFSIWALGFVALARAGVLANFDRLPPPAVFVFVAVFVAAIAFARSGFGTAFAHGLPTATLIGLQAFRFPLELVMHQAANEGVMPEQMTYTGLNFDIATGIAALVVFLAYRDREPPRAVTVGFAVLGTTLLAAILGIALASSPIARAFGDDPSVVNTFVFHAPFIVLPTVLVLIALAGQLVLFRRIAWLGADGTDRAIASVTAAHPEKAPQSR